MDLSYLTRLSVPAPPMLEAALGYRGDRRYVALLYDTLGEQPRVDDGGNGAAVPDEKAWRAFVDHSVVALAIATYGVWDGSSPVGGLLVLDRKERTLYAGRFDQFDTFLRTTTGEQYSNQDAMSYEGSPIDDMKVWLDEIPGASIAAEDAAAPSPGDEDAEVLALRVKSRWMLGRGFREGVLDLLGEIRSREQALIANDANPARHFKRCTTTVTRWRDDYLILLTVSAWDAASATLDDIHDLEHYMLDQLMSGSK